jgi:RNA polymerase sigma-70 factor (ECF subfamily)
VSSTVARLAVVELLPDPPGEQAGPVRAEGVPARERLERLVDEHFDGVWRFLRRLGVPPGAVEDAVQESFAVVARHMGRIAPGCEKSFLFGTAVRVAKSARRRGAVEGARYAAMSGDERASGPSPEELVENRRALKVLDELLASLDEPYRTVFVLFELEGFTLTEISELLSIPRGTAASRCRRARAEFLRGAQRLRARGER